MGKPGPDDVVETSPKAKVHFFLLNPDPHFKAVYKHSLAYYETRKRTHVPHPPPPEIQIRNFVPSVVNFKKDLTEKLTENSEYF